MFLNLPASYCNLKMSEVNNVFTPLIFQIRQLFSTVRCGPPFAYGEPGKQSTFNLLLLCKYCLYTIAK